MNEQFPLHGAGRKYEPAPHITVYRICETCGRADDEKLMREGMCPDCLRLIRDGLRRYRDQHPVEHRPMRLDIAAAFSISLWAAVILWRWMR